MRADNVLQQGGAMSNYDHDFTPDFGRQSNFKQELRDLADTCETAGVDFQGACLAAAHQQLPLLEALGTAGPDAILRSARFSAVGAFESAVLALMPPHATVTGGKLADGRVIAQVVLVEGTGAHSHRAHRLAMAWLAALLRALAAADPANAGKQP